jgi:thiol reductant ABC exporter CydD subunit
VGNDDGRVRPVDPRLLRYARATRAYLVVMVGLGVVAAVLVVTQAWLLSGIVDGGFRHGEGVAELRGALLALAVVVVGRAVLAWATEAGAARSSARAKSQLRAALLERAVRLRPTTSRVGRTGELVTLATTGVDALDAYFARYLPQLVLAVLVPLGVVVVLAANDLLSAVLVAVTLPLIPVFMAVIGITTRARTERRLATLERLAGHFLDVVAGLPTLKVFGRAKAQARAIRDVTEAYRRTTLDTLRVTFLSALVLELVATLSVALVAVSVGLRLLGGELGFRTALYVLLLAPEAYLPLRQVGANFHASVDGIAAAGRVFDVLELPEPVRGRRVDVPDPGRHALEVRDLTVVYDGRAEPALDGVSLRVEPGEVVAVTGPSGCGKSTLVAALLGFVEPASGQLLVGDVDLATTDPDAWRAMVTWVPQRPYLFAGTLRANVALGRPDASDEVLGAALDAAGLGPVVARLPDGLATPLGEGGSGLSAGERQRVALARAFVRDAPLLLLDEPTAALDGATEAEVLAAVGRLARGRTVLLVAHRPALVALADREVRLAPARAEVVA